MKDIIKGYSDGLVQALSMCEEECASIPDKVMCKSFDFNNEHNNELFNAGKKTALSLLSFRIRILIEKGESYE